MRPPCSRRESGKNNGLAPSGGQYDQNEEGGLIIEVIGWASSLILLATLVKQVYKQWKDRTSEGISKWLFIGQLCASIGFTVYSYHTGSWVFAFTNAMLTLNNIIGIALYFKYRDADAAGKSCDGEGV